MNPKRCMKCLFHGEVASHSVKECIRANCNCRRCSLLRERRQIVNTLVRESKTQKIKLEIKESKYTCSKCRHHGIVSIKKFHTPCPYQAFHCRSCTLTEDKRRIENELAKANNRIIESSTTLSTNTAHDAVETTVPILVCNNNEFMSAEAKAIMDLVNLRYIDQLIFSPKTIDPRALHSLFSQPYIRLPDEWKHEMPAIIKCVQETLDRFPVLRKSCCHFWLRINSVALLGERIDSVLAQARAHRFVPCSEANTTWTIVSR
ncbi:hypothetical protein PRIPAC_80601 [Pristionchus pacificus]|uniref:DM domain-containing protein n=1 Tax=Pristionchus pacificus TaxID=54126 RepID=A0A2A6CQP8_PRIPA|nr:hypothetical protein PRIPAC_80601 [Pristionchus pacificus]|eukprot:PDM80363.1 hypothetical protein PRIPAC_32942 [Pristionchus pacificus]